MVLDTNIYRDDPKRQKLPFKAFERLVLAESVTLYVPYVVEREFQTQQRKKYDGDLKSTLSGLSALSNFSENTSSETLRKIPGWYKELTEASGQILADAENEIIEWFDKVQAIRVPVCGTQAHNALEAYFQGEPPFKEPKVRSDIPDSFIARSVEKINAENGEVHFVVNDKKLGDSFEGRTVEIYETLSEFIESDFIQKELFDLDVLENYAGIKKAIRKFEKETGTISAVLNKDVGEKIVWSTLEDTPTLDENNEATINSYYEPKNIKINYDEMAYFGDGEFGIPFSLTIDVQAYYYIYKADYYSHYGEGNGPSVTDHNDHYYEAEEDFNVAVKGAIKLSVIKDKLPKIKDFSFIDEKSIEIADISSVEIAS